jgi:hypothetical protein
LAKAFFVQQNTVIPVVVSGVSIAVNIAGAVLLAPVMGVQGLALAFSISSLLQLTVLLSILHWRLKVFNDREVLVSLSKITVAALLAGASSTALLGCGGDATGLGLSLVPEAQVEQMGIETWERIRAETPATGNRSYQERSQRVTDRVLRAAGGPGGIPGGRRRSSAMARSVSASFALRSCGVKAMTFSMSTWSTGHARMVAAITVCGGDCGSESSISWVCSG